MTRRWTVLLGTIAVAVAVAWVLHLRGSTADCEVAAAKHQWELMARVCEETYHRTGDAEAGSRTLMGLSALHRTAEVDRRLSWLEGTRFASAATYYRAVSAEAGGDDDSAMRLYAETVVASRQAGLHDYAAMAAHQLVSKQWTYGQFQAAFVTLDTAFEEARLGDDPLVSRLLDGQLADLLGEVGDPAGQARALSALASRSKDEPWILAQVRLRQGMVEVERANLLLARDSFQSALDGSRDAGLLPIVRSAHVSLANLACRNGDLDGGDAHLAAAAEIPPRFGYDQTAWDFAKVTLLRERGDCEAARELAGGALDAGALPDWQWQLLTVEGSCAERQGDDAAALRAFSQATAVIEALRRAEPTEALRSGILAPRREPYEALFELALRMGDSETAVEVMEQLLARAFEETMAKRAADESGDLRTARLVAEHRLAALESRVSQQRPMPGPVMGLLGELGDRDAIGFVVARGTVYRAHVSGGQIEFARVERLEKISELLDRLAATPDELGAAEALGALLWPSKKVATRVIIVADGALANLSFAGLRRLGRWLVEDHVISRAPSLGAAATLGRRPRGTTDGGVQVLGDPTGDLPAAAAEARALAHRFGVEPLVQHQASVAELMRSCHADLLHFAGHSGLGPEGGWLALADGTVTAARLLQAGCAPRVVFLSSCASGARVAGQAASTVAEAFFAAGSQQVIATTHSVDDAVAARFTSELFLGGAFDRPAEQVAEAQRRLLKSYPRSTWEPFFVLGL